ncbi:MAG: NAD-dependent epimerase/dehydratase family protein [Actinomycetota bacterium]|nr:NAD-dependent epimerase/dehydratase family protein [Actinomycetota bacterium]
MKVLVTGAAGFIGAAVGTALEAAGAEVVRVDCYLPQAHGHAERDPRVHVVDVRTADSWTALLGGVDAVSHQAAMVGAGVSIADLPTYAGINDLGTAALLAAMHAAEVAALVLASSMVVYGEGRYACPEHGRRKPGPRDRAALEVGEFENHCPECGRPLDWRGVPETARLDPRGGYAASKVAQEHYTAAWVRQAGARAIGLRYHNVYGPLMPRDTPYSGVAAMFRSALEAGRAPRVFEDGGQLRDFVHVDDVARANVTALERVVGRPAGSWTAYNVCSGRPISVGQVATVLAEATAGPAPVVTGEFRLTDVRHLVAAPERAATELGFTADITPQAGLRRFATDPLRASVTRA